MKVVKKNLRDASGVITVMVTLMLIPLLSFGTLIMEAGRYLSAKQVLADAQITASMSILANYNTYLYERFGIIAIDPDETSDKTKEAFISELRYNSDNVDGVSSSSKLYNLNSDITFETIYNLSDYTVLKRQVLEYAKYSVPYTVISNKLDFDSLFEKLKEKITDNAVFNVIEKIIASTEESVNVMDLAFTALGRVEYRTYDFLNFIYESNNREYNKDSYQTKELYDEYIKKDGEINGGKLDKRKRSERYVSGREEYINAIEDKMEYMSNNPDPANSLKEAKTILRNAGGQSTVNSAPLYKAAIRKFLEEEANKPTQDNPKGKGINEFTTVDITYSYSGYSGSYDLEKGTAAVNSVNNRTETEKINLQTAIKKVFDDKWYVTKATDYAELKNIAEDKGITKNSSKYLGEYTDNLKKNGKSAAAARLVAELQTKKNTYDADIEYKNQTIDEKAQLYIDDLITAKSMLGEIVRSIENREKMVKELVKNDKGEMVEGTKNTSHYEGAIGRLEYAQETYKAQNEEAEKSADLGSNAENVEVNIGDVVTDLKSRKNDATNAIKYINVLIQNVKNTEAAQIKSYSHSNGEDEVNGKTTVGATCSKIAEYVSGEFTKIEKFAETPVVDAEGDGFSVESITNKLGISDVWNAISKIKDTLNFIPATYDKAYVVTLNDSDLNLLPKMTETTSYNKSDEQYVKELLSDVNRTLGDVFSGTVFGDSIVDQDMSGFQSTTSSLFGSSDGESTGDSSVSNLYGNADSNKNQGILKLVVKIKEIIESIKSVFQSLKNLFGSFKELIMGIGKSAYYTVLINTYITQKFPSRMNSVSDATTFTIKATSGSYFSSCCVEYCIFGNKSEKSNQQSAFWMIFGIRAIVNCIQILVDAQAMEIISACNIFAPLMFIAMLYMETNIDMNLMMRLGEKVPLWKSHIHLSAEGVKEILKDLEDLMDNSVYVTTSGYGKRYHEQNCRTLSNSKGKQPLTVKNALDQGYTACAVCKPERESGDNDDGFFSLSYDNYLYVLMLFVSSKTKLQHLADLIQLETRYYETKQGISSNFRIDKTATYVRSEAVASYNTLLPMFSLGSSGNGFAELNGLEYVGY